MKNESKGETFEAGYQNDFTAFDTLRLTLKTIGEGM